MAMYCLCMITIIIFVTIYVQYMLYINFCFGSRVFPWECVSMFMNLIVNQIQGLHPPVIKEEEEKEKNKGEEIISTVFSKDPDTTVIRQQLTRRISCSERKP